MRLTVANRLYESGVRANVDDSDNTVGKKIRTHRENEARLHGNLRR